MSHAIKEIPQSHCQKLKGQSVNYTVTT